VDYNDGHRYRDEVYGRIRHRFIERTTGEWIELCDQHGVWAGPVYDYDALERDPHVRATGAFVDQPQGDSVIRTTRVPIRMSATPPAIRRGAPQLGADTVDVLRGVGFDGAEVAALTADGVVGVLAEPGTPAGDRGVEMSA
jgi:crotonobetainyl-CoA:carnitine CoA-transferase CaiB-like acyl-CoA transferase